jgi:hypothetical protein
MAETVAGGVYEDAPGAGTYHDANGKPVTKEAVAEHLKLVAERAKKAKEVEAELVRQQAAQLAGLRQLMTPPVPQAVKPPATVTPPQTTGFDTDAESLAAQIERRNKRS